MSHCQKSVLFFAFVAVWWGCVCTYAEDALQKHLTMQEAEKAALANNPRMTMGMLAALMQNQAIREVRSRELPQLNANITAVDARGGSRITAGFLNNPSLYSRAAVGISASQLLTDFGRTRNLVRSSQKEEKAREEDAAAIRQALLLAADQAFLNALIQQRLLVIAEKTVADRQTMEDKIEALTRAKLRSTLDQSFAEVQLSQAELQRMDAESNAQNALYDLAEIMGTSLQANTFLVEEEDPLPLPGNSDANELVQLAIQARPDLAALVAQEQASHLFSKAEHELQRPVISAMGVVGNTPERSVEIVGSWYGAAGVNLNLPVWNGSLFSARSREAELRDKVAQEQIVQCRNRIERDVRKTWQSTQAAYQKIAVTNQILEEANEALRLAEARYKLGLSSIVELSQAQSAQTAAEIDTANARYAYRIWIAELHYQTGQ